MIYAVTSTALGDLASQCRIVARTSSIVNGPLSDGPRFDRVFDHMFDGPVDEIVPAILAEIDTLARESEVVYVVPSIPGDSTIAQVAQTHEVEVRAGKWPGGSWFAGQCTVIDALEIAQAGTSAPFDRGLVNLDPTVPTIVTNWYGQTVVDRAGEYLRRLYDSDTLPGTLDGTTLVIQSAEYLELTASVAQLEHVVARLRRPDGCPWDREQTRESLYPQFVEELEELGEALDNGDVDNQREELGDVLFHIIAQCQLAAEAGDFTFDDVVRGINAKLVRRHPHVFGDVKVESYDDVLATWNRVKAEEKAAARSVMQDDGGNIRE